MSNKRETALCVDSQNPWKLLLDSGWLAPGKETTVYLLNGREWTGRLQSTNGQNIVLEVNGNHLAVALSAVAAVFIENAPEDNEELITAAGGTHDCHRREARVQAERGAKLKYSFSPVFLDGTPEAADDMYTRMLHLINTVSLAVKELREMSETYELKPKLPVYSWSDFVEQIQSTRGVIN